MNTDKIIIVPTDFTEVCDNAIHHGVELAKHLKYNVTLLHVIDRFTKSDLKKESLGVESIDHKLKAVAEKYRKADGPDISYLAREGNIFETISEVAEEIKAELMVLGTHGKVGMQHITGSYAYKVVTTAPCPTIVVQNRTIDKGYNHIIFPVREVDYVRQQVQWTIKVAKTFDATIHFFIIDTKNEELHYKLDIVTQQLQQIFNYHQVKYIIKRSEGSSNFTNQVIRYAGETRADLIMIMSQNDVFGFKISPAEEKMIFNNVQIPVMCVNPRELNMYRISL